MDRLIRVDGFFYLFARILNLSNVVLEFVARTEVSAHALHCMRDNSLPRQSLELRDTLSLSTRRGLIRRPGKGQSVRFVASPMCRSFALDVVFAVKEAHELNINPLTFPMQCSLAFKKIFSE